MWGPPPGTFIWHLVTHCKIKIYNFYKDIVARLHTVCYSSYDPSTRSQETRYEHPLGHDRQPGHVCPRSAFPHRSAAHSTTSQVRSSLNRDIWGPLHRLSGDSRLSADSLMEQDIAEMVALWEGAFSKLPISERPASEE